MQQSEVTAVWRQRTGWMEQRARVAVIAFVMFVGAGPLRAQGVYAPAAATQGATPATSPAAVPSLVPSATQTTTGTQAGGLGGREQGQGSDTRGRTQSSRGQDARNQDARTQDARKRDSRTQDGRSRDAERDGTQGDDSLREVLPPPPTEFQLLVSESTGVDLPIFGASLFAGALPSTFAPVDDIPVAQDYVIGPGDVLQIQLYGQINDQGEYLVDRSGDIVFPEVGTLHVAGVRYEQLASFLKTRLSRVYRNFQLSVNLGQLRSIPVFVVGQARRPGAYTVSSLSTLLNALFVSGGPMPQGSLRDIQLLRGGVAIVHFDLYDLLLRGDKSKDVTLAAGDVLFIPTVGAQAAVVGSVNNPAIYELRQGDRLAELLQLAGGESPLAAGGSVRLERVFEHTMRSVVDVDRKRGDDPVLVSGDIVTVGAILNRYAAAVTLRGNVTMPGRYVWRPGMRILDLVPNREQLITRSYYTRRNALGLGRLGYEQTAGIAAGESVQAAPGSLRVNGDEQTQGTDNAVKSGSAAIGTNGGNSVGAALTGSNSAFRAENDVVLSAPDINWTYAVVERLNQATLTTSLLPFNPGALFLHNDQTQNLELLSGDVVTFFSTADLKVPTVQQTRFVRLEGEFNASGVYSVEPGETLRHLIARAGGFTPQAYLYASEFTRLSTRRVEQQRLAEYADTLEAQVAVTTSTSSARATTDRDAAASAAEAVEARQTIARLRRIVPIGRIVLELKPDSRTVESIPDLPLEDGDRFIVPRTPATVSVEGQVYSANAFVFLCDQRERDYLRRAGGPDRQADRKRSFIIRADGSVFSHQYGNVERAHVFPGDTIVIPPQLQRRAVLRNLIDVANIIGQFGLGAAAIELLTK